MKGKDFTNLHISIITVLYLSRKMVKKDPNIVMVLFLSHLLVFIFYFPLSSCEDYFPFHFVTNFPIYFIGIHQHYPSR